MMVSLETIKSEILGYSVEKDVIGVEFDDYILEVDLKDMDQLVVNKENLAKIIFEKYQ